MLSTGSMGNLPVGTGSRTTGTGAGIVSCVGAGTGTGGVSFFATMAKTASTVLDKIFVPLPSEAVIAASDKVMMPLPLPLAVNTIFKT